jgi:hypothetical protein
MQNHRRTCWRRAKPGHSWPILAPEWQGVCSAEEERVSQEVRAAAGVRTNVGGGDPDACASEGFTTTVSSGDFPQSDSTFRSMTCIDAYNEDNDLLVDLWATLRL